MELTIDKTTENITLWQQKSYLSEATKFLLRKADVLIVPDENFREYPLPVFQRETMEIFEFLKAQLKIEVAIDDENYREVALNNRVHRIGKYVVNIAILPLFIGLLTNYIYDKLKFEDPTDEVEVEIVVDKNGEGNSIKFKGTTNDLKKVKQDIIDLRDVDNSNHREDSTKSHSPGFSEK